MKTYNRAVVNNVDRDGLFEVIVYDNHDEKVVQCKVKDLYLEILSETPAPTPRKEPAFRWATEMSRFKADMRKLALDERDNYPVFEEYVKERVEEIPPELQDTYEELMEAASAAIEAAEDLAHCYRLGSKVDIAKAEEKFELSMESL